MARPSGAASIPPSFCSLKEAAATKKREQQESSSSRSLVLVKDGAVAAHFGAVTYRRASSRGARGDAFTSGFDAGSKVDATRRGVGHSGGATRIGG